MNKKYFKWMLLVLFSGPMMFLNSCTIVFNQKIKDGLVSQMNDFTNVTKWISKGIILSNEKKWNTTNLIRNILEIKKDDLEFKNIFSSYFGNLNSDKWNPVAEDFFLNSQIKEQVLPKDYQDDYNQVINQNKIFEKINLVGSFLQNLSADTINTALNNDSVLETVVSFLKSKNVKDYWEQYLTGSNQQVFDNLIRNIDEHQGFIRDEASYEKVLKWSEIKIKQIVINIQCNQGQLTECNNFKTDDDKFKFIMSEFLKLQVKINQNNFNISGINETIKDNFLKAFKSNDNIVSLIIPALPIISWIIKINSELWPSLESNQLEFSKEKNQIKTEMNKKYTGLDFGSIKKIKQHLMSIFSIKDLDYNIQKILLIFRLTPALNNLVTNFSINIIDIINGPLIDILAYNKINIFKIALAKVKNSIIEVFNKIVKYLNFIPDHIKGDNVDFNNLLYDFNKLLKSIKNILSNENFIQFKEVIKQDNEEIRRYFLQLIGYVDGTIIVDGFIETFITVIKGNDNVETESLKLIKILTNQEGVINKLMKQNEAKVSTEYKHFYLEEDYWDLSDQKMVFNESKDRLELTYKISFKNGNIVNKYSIKWISNFLKDRYKINFKIIEFIKE